MKVLDSYICRAWYLMLATVLLSFMALFILLTAVSELGDVNEHYGIASALAGTVLRIPHFLWTLLPVALLISTCTAMAGLARRRELVAAMSAGIRHSRIALLLLVHGCLPLMLLAIVNNELLLPQTQRMVQELEQNPGATQVATNVWLSSGDQHIFAGTLGSQGYMQDITVFSYDQHDPRKLLRVEQAEYAMHLDDGWHMFAVTGSLAEEPGQSYALERKAWDADLDPAQLAASSKWDATAPLPEIARSALHSDNHRYIVFLWHRISYPVVLALMLVIGVILVSPNSRNYLAVGKAVAVLIAYFVLQRFSDRVAFAPPFGLSPWLVVAVPLMFLAAVAAFLYRADSSLATWRSSRT